MLFIFIFLSYILFCYKIKLFFLNLTIYITMTVFKIV